MAVGHLLITGSCVAIFIILAIKLIQLVMSRRKLYAAFKDFPQNPANPIFGNLFQHPGPNDAGMAYQRDQVRKFSRLKLFWFALMPMINLQHPETLKLLMTTSEPKSVVYKFMDFWLGEGLLMSKGKKWMRNRRLLTLAFHFDILKDYLKLKNKLCEELLVKFEAAAISEVSMKLCENISLFTLDVMLQSTMSYKTGCQKGGENHPYIQAVYRLTKKVAERYFKPWLHPDFVYGLTPSGWSFMRDCRYVHKVADEIITKRRVQLESENVSSECERPEGQKRKYKDFLDTLITARDEDGNGLTNREIRDEVDTFLFEGHDTTSSAISWCLYSIAEHLDIQRRVQEEVDGLFAGRESDNLLWEDMSQLPYLTMVIKESLRLHSPVPFISRQLTKDMVIDGLTIPSGSTVAMCIYNLHHNPTVWEDSMRFDPERFSPQEIEKRDPFAFVPFSAGPRNCIGQNFAMDEIKVCLARILHRYTISLDPTHKVTKFSDLVIRADNDIKLYVKTRNFLNSTSDKW